MKTNKIMKMLTALTGILIILSMTPAVFAQTDNSAAGKETAETQTTTDGSAAKTPQKPSRKSGQPDFSKLPENLTEEDLEEFFEKYFSEKGKCVRDLFAFFTDFCYFCTWNSHLQRKTCTIVFLVNFFKNIFAFS